MNRPLTLPSASGDGLWHTLPVFWRCPASCRSG
jgi:hypothetical protein